jgi:hypothetical protein
MISIQLTEYEKKINGDYKANDIFKNYYTIEHGYLKVTMNQNL